MQYRVDVKVGKLAIRLTVGIASKVWKVETCFKAVGYFEEIKILLSFDEFGKKDNVSILAETSNLQNLQKNLQTETFFGKSWFEFSIKDKKPLGAFALRYNKILVFDKEKRLWQKEKRKESQETKYVFCQKSGRLTQRFTYIYEMGR